VKERAGIVRIDGRRAGTLTESGREVVFQYDDAWLADAAATPVALTLPLRAEPYVADGLHPFFQNLLPEGWLLELAALKLKVSKDDAFGLLLATCADCVGDVEILPAADDTP